MALVSDLLNEAFMDIGGYTSGETMTALEQADAFMRLNQLLASWSTEQLTAPSMTHTGFALTAGVNLYTVGTGGSLVTTGQVMRVTGASSVSGNFRSGMKVMSFEEFSEQVRDPLAASTVLGEVLAADGSFPSINVRIHPMPAAAPGTLWLDYWMAIAQFTTVGQTVALPPGWERALHLNLAVEIYPQYARAGGMDPVLQAKAQEAKGALDALNAAILGETQQQAPPAQGGGQ